jgi:Na+/melibiose symporter-like transporter
LSVANGAPAAARTPLPTIMAFGTVGMPLAGILLMFVVYLPRFYVGLGISFVLVGLAIPLVRVIDGPVDAEPGGRRLGLGAGPQL